MADRKHRCSAENMVVLPGGDAFNHTLRVVDALPKDQPLLRLAGLLHDVGKARTAEVGEDREVHFYRHEVVGEHLVLDLAARFRMSCEQTEYLADLVLNHMFPMGKNLTKTAVKRFMQRCPHFADVAKLRVADKQGNLVFSACNEAYEGVERFLQFVTEIEEENAALKVTDLEVNGHDLMNLGMNPGPEMGRVLRELLDLVVDEELENDRETLLDHVRRNYV
jgi:putative nucleotidyltransferase with HDIG domain